MNLNRSPKRRRNLITFVVCMHGRGLRLPHDRRRRHVRPGGQEDGLRLLRYCPVPLNTLKLPVDPETTLTEVKNTLSLPVMSTNLEPDKTEYKNTLTFPPSSKDV